MNSRTLKITQRSVQVLNRIPQLMPTFVNEVERMTGHRVQNMTGRYLPADPAPEGMTIAQTQLLWSSSLKLFGQQMLTAVLAKQTRHFLRHTQSTDAWVSTLHSHPLHPEALPEEVFSLLRQLARSVFRMHIHDHGDHIVVSRPVWSHLSHQVLEMLVKSGKAPESLDELLMAQDLGL